MSAILRLTNFRVLSFDCYGTLIDWESGLWQAYHKLRSQVGEGLSRDSLLEKHALYESAAQAANPTRLYPNILEDVYEKIGQEYEVSTPELCQEGANIGKSVRDWPAFSDSAEALRYLKDHYVLVILSNIDRESFSQSQEKLGIRFDYIFTAQDIGSYKPNLRNFHYMLACLEKNNIKKEHILHVAESLFHDHLPANEIGLRSAWIYRRHDQKGFGATAVPDRQPSVDFQFNSLNEMVQAHHLEKALL